MSILLFKSLRVVIISEPDFELSKEANTDSGGKCMLTYFRRD